MVNLYTRDRLSIKLSGQFFGFVALMAKLVKVGLTSLLGVFEHTPYLVKFTASLVNVYPN